MSVVWKESFKHEQCDVVVAWELKTSFEDLTSSLVGVLDVQYVIERIFMMLVVLRSLSSTCQFITSHPLSSAHA